MKKLPLFLLASLSVLAAPAPTKAECQANLELDGPVQSKHLYHGVYEYSGAIVNKSNCKALTVYVVFEVGGVEDKVMIGNINPGQRQTFVKSVAPNGQSVRMSGIEYSGFLP